LEAELACIDLLLRREVRRWVLAGQDPNDDYRGMYVTRPEAESLLDRPFGVSWGQWIVLPPAEEEALQTACCEARQQADAIAQQLTAQGKRPRLLQLADDFGLDRTELDILLLCMAPAFDTKYERLYGYLQDNVTRRRPSVRLVLDLLGDPGVEKFALAAYLNVDAPLFQHGLLEHVIEPPPANAHWLNQTLQPSETMSAWLRGYYEPQSMFVQQAGLVWVVPDATDEILAGDVVRCLPLIPANRPPIIVFSGSDQLRQQAAVCLLAARYNQPVLSVKLKPIVGDETPALTAVKVALRDARLTGAVLYLHQWEVCVNSEKAVDPALLTVLCAHPGLVIVAGEVTWQIGGFARTRTLLHQEFSTPTYAQRRLLWRHFLDVFATGAAATPAEITDSELAHLAGQFVVTSGIIRDVVAAAYDQATQAGRAVNANDLFAMARRYSNPRLSTLARKLEPRYDWADIILAAEQMAILHELVATVRQRPKVLEEWGVGKKLASSAGVTVLFAGPPGTGKTMAAEVIAKELRLDLYKIDLSSVVSKYIGETEKNLEKIFTEAASSNAILFFDEADAIFGKRAEVKDAHDRYANVEVSYLLQRMETYDGVTILATNLRANLDDAFTRRLHFAVDFPFPRVEERLRIWETLFPEAVPRAVGQQEFKILAKRFELAGGSIRNIIVSAAYLAADNGQVVTMEHLLHGARRELMKMGRLVEDGEFYDR
jgi:ATP-dependent 26S proteasome regulatory subunit